MGWLQGLLMQFCTLVNSGTCRTAEPSEQRNTSMWMTDRQSNQVVQKLTASRWMAAWLEAKVTVFSSISSGSLSFPRINDTCTPDLQSWLTPTWLAMQTLI